MNFNYNFEIVAISNSLVYFWKNDQTCKKTFMENSLLKNNIFQISVFANLQVPNASVYWSYMTIIDNFMSLRPIIKILEGICNLTNVTIIHNIFPNPNNLHYVFSFESDNKVYITNSQFIDNGAGGRKKVYLSAYEGALINLWSMTYSYFDNNLFISSEMAELGSGFISASPHGGIFILYNSTFIILNTNTNYRYKGLLLDHFTEATIIGNVFINLMCNNLSFIHIHGSFSLVASSSYSYSQNSYFVLLENNHFINCSCVNGGALGILSISNIIIKNCTFQNSTASHFSGHLLAISGINVTLSYLIFNISSADEGAGVYLKNFNSVKINEIEIYNAFSRKSGVLFCRDIYKLEISSFITKNTNSLMNGGVLNLYNTLAFVQNITIYDSFAEINGGCIMVDGNSTLYLTNLFVDNSSAFIGGCICITRANIVILSNITMKHVFSKFNGGGIYIDDIKAINISNLSIINGISLSNGIIMIETDDENTLINIENIVCENTKANEGSCIYYLSSSKLNIINLIITNNGPIPIHFMWSYQIIVNLTNILLQNSYSTSFLMVFSGVNFHLNSITIFENIALFDIFYIYESEGYLDLMNLQNNKGDSIFYLENSILSIINLFLSNSIDNVYLLNIINGKNSQININNSNFIKMQSSGSSLILMTVGKLIIHNVRFSSNNGTLIDISLVNMILSECELYNMKSLDLSYPNDIKSDNPDDKNIYYITILNCKFSIFSGFSLYFQGSLAININNCLFKNYNNQSNGDNIYSLYNENINFLKIINSSFVNFTSSALQFFSDKYLIFLYTNIIIESSEFINNSAILGSSLYFQGNFQILIEKCQFLSNHALIKNSISNNFLEGIASCVFFLSENNYLSKIELNSNYFFNNKADNFSPTIFSDRLLEINNNVFDNNSDSINFTVKAFSYPLHLSQINLNETEFMKENNTIKITSGSPFSLYFIIEDYFNQTLIFDNNSLFDLRQKLSNQINDQYILIENRFAQTKNGKITLNNVIIKTTPNTYFQLTLTGNFLGLGQSLNNEKNYYLNIDLNFFAKPCSIGQIIAQDWSCFTCLTNTYSNIILFEKSICHQCPANAFCPGGSLIIPNPGYWRISPDSYMILPCENSAYCISIPPAISNAQIIKNLSIFQYSSDVLKGYCLNGHESNLCQECKFGFGKYTNEGNCIECQENMTLVILRICIVFSILIVYLIFTNHDMQKYTQSTLFEQVSKVYINHFQKISITLIIDYQIYIGELKEIFNIFNVMSFLTDDIFSNDCFVQNFISKNNIDKAYFFKVLITLVLPIILALISVIIISIIYIKNQRKLNRHNYQNQFITMIFISIFLFYPLLTRSSLSLLNCVTLDNSNQTYMYASPNLLCWNSTHILYFFTSGFLGVICFGIGFPFGLFYIIRKHIRLISKIRVSNSNKTFIEMTKDIDVKNLTDSQVTLKKKNFEKKISIDENSFGIYHFFYKDYKTQFFYWEMIIFMQKFLLTLLQNLNHFFNSETINVSFILLLFIYLIFVIKLKPFRQDYINKLETNSVIIAIITKYCLLLSMSDYFKSGLKMSFVIFQLILNILFIIHVIFILIKYTNWKEIVSSGLKTMRKVSKGLNNMRSYISSSNKNLSSNSLFNENQSKKMNFSKTTSFKKKDSSLKE